MDFRKLRNFQIILIGLLMLINVCRGGHFLQLSSDEYHCGRQLAEFLESLCQGNINTLGKTKRSGFIDYINDDTTTSDDLVGTDIDGSYIQSQPGSGRLFTRVRRYGLGVYNECCKRPCTIPTLKSYCS